MVIVQVAANLQPMTGLAAPNRTNGGVHTQLTAATIESPLQQARQPRVFLARLGQRRRGRFRELLLLVAYVIQPVCQWLAVSLTPEVRIPGRFVELLAAQVTEPRLDIAARNHNENRIRSSKRLDAPFLALTLQLRSTSFRRFRIGIDDHNQGGPAPSPNLLQLVGKLFTHTLLPGSLASGKRDTGDLASEPAAKPATEEATEEHVRLRVLTEQNHAGAHRSQPLATTSENDADPASGGGSYFTRASPSSSRKNHLAFPPR